MQLVPRRPSVIESRVCASSLRDPLPFALRKVGSVPLADDFIRNEWVDKHLGASSRVKRSVAFLSQSNRSRSDDQKKRYVSFMLNGHRCSEAGWALRACAIERDPRAAAEDGTRAVVYG